MRWVAALVLTGCASASLPPTTAPAEPTVARATPEARCPRGGYLTLVERESGGARRSTTLSCDHATVAVSVDAPLVDGEPAHEGSHETFDLEPETADALWRVVADVAWTRWTSCEGHAPGPRYEVEVDDGRRRRIAHCEGHLPASWARVLEALRDEADRPVDPEALWPFEYDADYWRDELGHYRAPLATAE